MTVNVEHEFLMIESDEVTDHEDTLEDDEQNSPSENNFAISRVPVF